MKTGTKADVLRREGLYTGDIQRFEDIARKGAINALAQSRPRRRKKIVQGVSVEAFEAMKHERSRKEKALAELATEFTILKKSEWGVIGEISFEHCSATIKSDILAIMETAISKGITQKKSLRVTSDQ